MPSGPCGLNFFCVMTSPLEKTGRDLGLHVLVEAHQVEILGEPQPVYGKADDGGEDRIEPVLLYVPLRALALLLHRPQSFREGQECGGDSGTEIVEAGP